AAPVTPSAPVLSYAAPSCDEVSVTVSFTPEDDVEYSLNADFAELLTGGSFDAVSGSTGVVYARTAGTTCVISSPYEIAAAPVTPSAPVLSYAAPSCDEASVTVSFTPEDGVEYSLNADFAELLTGGSFDAGSGSTGFVYARTAGTTCVISSPYEIAAAPIAPFASISINKSASQSTYVLGDVITYTFTVENTGDVELVDVNVEDVLEGLNWITSTNVASLASGASVTFTATYTITQSDIDEGSVINTATVVGIPSCGPPVSDDASVTINVSGMILGTVFNDANGNVVIDGEETGYLPGGVPHFVYLVDALGVIRGLSEVNADGTFAIPIEDNTGSFSLQISTNTYVLGEDAVIEQNLP
ncbi:DUF11 domain-containing protein, partial [Belliella kenyensis]|nr:DUF11 domain-containing protein [Belliella kenyensis]